MLKGLKRMKITGHNVYHESYWIANKHLLQKLIFMSTDKSLCFPGLFMSPWMKEHLSYSTELG
jgi:hypothetical protein